MDNSKNLIHIDDVFKGLREGEGKEQPGAWLKMKDILDKEMPVSEPVNRRGIFWYLLPLLALLLGGGLYWNYRNGAGVQPETSGTVATVSTLRHPESPEGRLPGKRPLRPEAASSGQGETPDTNPAAIAGGPIASAPSAVRAAHPAQGAARTTIIHPASGNIRNTASTTHAPTTAALAYEPAAPGKDKQPGHLLPAIHEEKVVEQIKPREQTPSNTAVADRVPGKHDPEDKQEWQSTGVDIDHHKVVHNKNGDYYKEVRDTITRMEITQTLPEPGPDFKSRIKMDTVSIARIEMIHYIPLSAAERIKLEKIISLSVPANGLLADASPAKIPAAAKNEKVDLVPLTTYKVSSHKMGPGAINRLRNTAGGIASLFDGTRRWYASVLLGGNAGIGSPNAYGMQLGIAALFAVTERWTLSAEFRYQNSLFPNFQLADESASYNVTGEKVPAGWLFKGTENKVTNNYTIRNKASLNMPVLLSYNLGRVSLFGGPEFSYFFPLKWNKERHLETIPVSQMADKNQSPFAGKHFALDEQNDFKARFALGYAVGLSYDFSRKISLDARVSQMLWDSHNAYNIKLLQNMYHQPTFELSFGFYFGRRDKVIYILDRKR